MRNSGRRFAANAGCPAVTSSGLPPRPHMRHGGNSVNALPVTLRARPALFTTSARSAVAWSETQKRRLRLLPRAEPSGRYCTR